MSSMEIWAAYGGRRANRASWGRTAPGWADESGAEAVAAAHTKRCQQVDVALAAQSLWAADDALERQDKAAAAAALAAKAEKMAAHAHSQQLRTKMQVYAPSPAPASAATAPLPPPPPLPAGAAPRDAPAPTRGISLNFFVQLVKEYCVNCNLHGFRYLAEPGRLWFERVLWLIICVVAWCTAFYLIRLSWQDFASEDALSFNLDTDRASWNTRFPSISVCEFAGKKNEMPPAFFAWLEQNYGSMKKFLRNIPIITEMRYFEGRADNLNKLCGKIECPATDLYTISWQERYNCSDIFSECFWNERAFNCCKFFHPLHSEMGVCYTINNRHTRGPVKDMTSNITTGPGALRFELKTAVRVFIHSPEDVLDLGAESVSVLTPVKGKYIMRGVSVVELANDVAVRDTTLEQRQCRFPDENYLTLFDRYSFSGCVIQCRMNAHLKECNCTSPLIPRIKPEQACDLEGMKCIAAFKYGLGWRQLRPEWDTESDALFCPCLLNCASMDINYPYELTTNSENKEIHSAVKIFLTQLPSERLERVVVRTKLGLVVDVGSALGLMIGASVLSLGEVIHFFALPVGRLLLGRHLAEGRCCRGPPPPVPRAPPPPTAATPTPTPPHLPLLRRTRSRALPRSGH